MLHVHSAPIFESPNYIHRRHYCLLVQKQSVVTLFQQLG
uniref:Uncharacterized protein n=1 Tax=Triticum urartu TaxID=4572 RepID=A0A8R7QX88_TRIUA